MNLSLLLTSASTPVASPHAKSDCECEGWNRLLLVPAPGHRPVDASGTAAAAAIMHSLPPLSPGDRSGVLLTIKRGKGIQAYSCPSSPPTPRTQRP